MLDSDRDRMDAHRVLLGEGRYANFKISHECNRDAARKELEREGGIRGCLVGGVSSSLADDACRDCPATPFLRQRLIVDYSTLKYVHSLFLIIYGDSII